MLDEAPLPLLWEVAGTLDKISPVTRFEAAPRPGVVSLPLLDGVLPVPDGVSLASREVSLLHPAAVKHLHEARDFIKGNPVHPGVMAGEAIFPATMSWKDWFLPL